MEDQQVAYRTGLNNDPQVTVQKESALPKPQQAPPPPLCPPLPPPRLVSPSPIVQQSEEHARRTHLSKREIVLTTAVVIVAILSLIFCVLFFTTENSTTKKSNKTATFPSCLQHFPNKTNQTSSTTSSKPDAKAITKHDCPSNWVPLISSCYYFSTTKASWSEARSSCLKLGGDLVVPKNYEESNAIWSTAKQRRNGYSWVGLVRYGDQRFYTVQGFKPRYETWQPGEPNNAGNDEKCVQYTDKNEWNDNLCSRNFKFICERPKLSCPSSWVPLISSCYLFSTNKTTWSNARSSCRNLGGDLAVPKNSNENNAIWKAAVKQRKHTYPWIGLVRHANQRFYTIHGSKPGYTAWGPVEPNNSGGSEYCVHYYYRDNDKWNDIRCSYNYNFICERPKLK